MRTPHHSTSEPGSLRLLFGAQQEVTVAPPDFAPETLVKDCQALSPEPADYQFTAWVVVVTGNISALGDLTSHRGQALRGKALEGLVDLCLLHFLDCQVNNPARADGPVQIGQHQWPAFGRDVFHRVDREDRV